jgi:hypothetical protein
VLTAKGTEEREISGRNRPTPLSISKCFAIVQMFPQRSPMGADVRNGINRDVERGILAIGGEEEKAGR